MWEGVSSRQHTLEKVFVASSGTIGSVEFMLLGTVRLTLETGESKHVDWAGHACARKEARAGAPWLFTYYRVYLQT